MSTNYPAALDNGTTLPNPSGANPTNNPSHAGLHDNAQDAIKAIEIKIGTGAATPVASRLLTATGIGTSDWSKVAPTGTIVGTTDNQILTSKTLTAPIINGGTIDNATITVDAISGHTVAGTGTIYGVNIAGGAITGVNSISTAALQAGGVTFAKLLPTIFSGQISTLANAGTAGGTMNYLNLGGLKLLWGRTAGLAVTGSGFQATSGLSISWPAGFFTVGTSPKVYLSLEQVSNSQYLLAVISNAATDVNTFIELVQLNGTNGSAPINFFAIGT